MAAFCPRQISFTIPGMLGVQVTATENGGNIDFTVDVLDSSALTGDLRGLFFQFNESKLGTLKITGGEGLITSTHISANSVIDLGNGNNMKGAASPFDVGIAFGSQGIGKGDDINGPVHFTLTDTAGPLTLDDFAGLQFGARVTSIGELNHRTDSEKIVGLAPAAPDAHDDAFNIFEDGASSLADPSKTPTAVTFNVLSNDTDADHDQLIITDVHQDAIHHGTVAIAPDGHSILYTPDLDYSGTDTFVYCVSDGHGGEDNATVNINVAAVADIPKITYSVALGATINEYLVTVTATQTDLDSSEFIDRIAWTGVPADVTITAVGDPNPADEPDQIAMQFVVTVPPKQDTDFNLNITAFSKEVSNGDEEQATAVVPIKFDFNENTAQETFSTINQSIWDPSLPAAFNDDRFIGVGHLAPDGSVVPVSDHTSVDIGVAEIGGSYSLALGLKSSLHATLGDIEATLPYNITIDTSYNVTTDSLLIDPSAALDPSAHFSTHGPGGSYNLDFVFDATLSAFLHPVVGPNLDPTVGPLDLGFNLLSIDSATFTKTIDLPPPPNTVTTLTLNWPHSTGVSTLETNGAPVDADTLHSDGTSVDIVNLDVDVIALALAVLGISPNPLDLGFVDLVELNVNGGVALAQHFDLNSVLDAALTLEDGTSLPFAFGSPLPIIPNASSHDANHDGQIDFGLHLTPDATLDNKTALDFHIGGDIGILDFNPGPTLFSVGADLDLGEIPIYHPAAFDVGGFNSQDYHFQV
jgi:Big-like domain-containing protein